MKSVFRTTSHPKLIQARGASCDTQTDQRQMTLRLVSKSPFENSGASKHKGIEHRRKQDALIAAVSCTTTAADLGPKSGRGIRITIADKSSEHAWTRTWPLTNPANFGVQSARLAAARKGGQDKGASIPDAPLNCKYPTARVLLKCGGKAVLSVMSACVSGQVTHQPNKIWRRSPLSVTRSIVKLTYMLQLRVASPGT